MEIKRRLYMGGGSIKRTGLYDKIMEVLGGADIRVSECAGIEPNPQYTSVNRAAKISRENDCNVIIAVGGGSVIDAAKVVAQAHFYDGDCWELVTKKVDEPRALPLIVIPTMASAGSENDAWAVISNADTNEKLDPWHAEARQNLSWISAMITGGIMDVGAIQDMALHMTEYGIAAFYEISHGHGIAILFPRWMQYILSEETAPVFYHFGQEVFGIKIGLEAMDGAQKTIDALSNWLYNEMGLESNLSEFGVEEAKLHDMAVKATENCGGVLHSLTTLTTEDVENIFRMCL